MAAVSFQYLALTNIPPGFHASDLRAHFSSLVESGSFLCFHFRHRPEKVSSDIDDRGNQKGRKLCCVVKIVRNKLEDLMRYNSQNWTNVDGEYLADRCHLSQIQLASGGTNVQDAVEEEKLLQMPELQPPDLMRQGNVGTPTLAFLELIQQCLLPHNLINKLHLKFPKTAARRIYANMHLDYGTSDSQAHANEGHGRYRHSRQKMLIRKPFAKNHVSLELEDASKQHQVAAAGGWHSSPAQGPGCETAQLEGEPEFSKVAHVNRDHSSNSDEVVEENNNHSCVNFKEPSRTTAGGDRLQCVPPKSVVTGSHPGLPTSQGFSGCNSSGSSHVFAQPAALPGNGGQKLTNSQRRRLKKQQQLEIKQLKAEKIEEKLITAEKRYQNDDDAEEWDRHEASEDDPSNQERNKERLYEEEIEQPWEKGGPGVVFYTDAVFWQEREGDFDEQTTDDLDVDFSVYEGEGAGDKDIQDFLKIRQEKRFREGYDSTDRFSAGIGKPLPESTGHRSMSRLGAFESHSKGIGRKLMERQGWREGQGLGRSMPGIVDALKGEGQAPYSKRGLGYTKAKPVSYTSSGIKRLRHQAHLITTIYDDPKVTDPKEPLLHRSEPSTLKHRQTHLDHFT
ncbi:unnamed protein product [Candidula unifasciata]|uniref:G-patch domain-containing protein n=1 Tax=Candidula unifasciata TaxID=100452 RepID=A0A8S3ZCM9_9EUPU|nr:unnamed protein product [Candidula unifasciata]